VTGNRASKKTSDSKTLRFRKSQPIRRKLPKASKKTGTKTGRKTRDAAVAAGVTDATDLTVATTAAAIAATIMTTVTTKTTAKQKKKKRKRSSCITAMKILSLPMLLLRKTIPQRRPNRKEKQPGGEN